MAKHYSGKGSEFAKVLQSMSNRFQTWELWSDFVTVFALALSQQLDPRDNRAKMYNETISKYSQDELQKFVQLSCLVTKAFEENREQDYLGQLYMELELGNHWTGQFFTPYHVCKAMASMTASDCVAEIEEKGYITMNDCACGGGATLIAGTNAVYDALKKAESPLCYQDHVLVVAQDLSQTTALMCYIQLSLLGIAAVIKVGDTLLNPFNYDPLFAPPDDDLWFTPMYFSDVWATRRMSRLMDKVLQQCTPKLPEDQPAPATVQEEHKELGKKYCRYCAYCIAGDAYYCNARDKVLNRVDRVTDCPDFVLSTMGDVDTGKPYNPRGSNDYGTLEQQPDSEQLTLF